VQFRAPLEDYPAEKWDELLRCNVSSVFHVGRAGGAADDPARAGQDRQHRLGPERAGAAPDRALHGHQGRGAQLTRGMCTDWARHGLQVNAVAPGYFLTPLNRALVASAEFTGWLEQRTPAVRWGQVEELVGAAVFLASDASSFVNGHILYVDGGITASL
jgi:gluconate 5-dehydrogenase